MKRIILAPAVALAVAGFGAAPVVLAPAAFASTVAEPTVTVATAELTQEESVAGVGFTIAGLPADVESVQVSTYTQDYDGARSLFVESVAIDGGSGSGTLVSETGTGFAPGVHMIELTYWDADNNKQEIRSGAFTITEASAETTLTVDKPQLTGEEYIGEGNGIVATASGLGAGEYTIQQKGPGDADWKFGTYLNPFNTSTEEYRVYGMEGYAPEDFEGTYSLRLLDGTGEQIGEVVTYVVGQPSDDDDDTPSPAPTPTEEEPSAPAPTPTDDDDADDDGANDEASEDEWTWNGAPLEEGLNLEADQVSTEKFVTDGVAFAVRGCEPGQDVNFEVSTGRDDVRPYTATVTADENGIAVHGVKGLDASQARAYIGEYTVTATCGDESWTDAFYVGDRGDDANPGDDTNDDDTAGGGSDNGGGNGLPRTGTELTGLAAGAGLLVIGAATMMFTRRRSAKTGPADI